MSTDTTRRPCLGDGLSFGDLCEGLLARTHDDQVPVRAAGFLKRWVIDELVAGVTA